MAERKASVQGKRARRKAKKKRKIRDAVVPGAGGAYGMGFNEPVQGGAHGFGRGRGGGCVRGRGGGRGRSRTRIPDCEQEREREEEDEEEEDRLFSELVAA